MNIEPKNHPFAKDNCLTKPPLYIVFNVYFPQGVICLWVVLLFLGCYVFLKVGDFPPRGVRTEF